jgi:hypothetical protein
MQASNSYEPLLLLALPPECLAAVLQRLRVPAALRGGDGTSDSASVCSVARTHSRLHAAPVAALSSIKAKVKQPQLDSLQLYLTRHAQHVSALALEDANPDDYQRLRLTELPPCSQLRSLSLQWFNVQLASSDGHPGVLQAAPQLTRLEVWGRLLDADSGALTAALAGLTALKHLKLCCHTDACVVDGISIEALAPQLTHLETSAWLLDDDEAGWQEQICGMSQLRELELQLAEGDEVWAGKFSGLQHLTRLAVRSDFGSPGSVEAAALANLPRLRNLMIFDVAIAGESPAAALLQALGQLQELTWLRLSGVLDSLTAPAPAYSALTGSSRLQHLALFDSQLPPGAWQHVFARPRPALQELAVHNHAMRSPRDVESIVTACPGLQRLTLEFGSSTALAEAQSQQMLAPLARLSQLSMFEVKNVDDAAVAAASAALAQLSGLRSLSLFDFHADLTTAGLLVLTALQSLTFLSAYYSEGPAFSRSMRLFNKVRGCGWVD